MFQGSDFGSIIFEISRKIHGKAFCSDFEPLSSESIQHFLKNKLHSYMFFTNLGTMVGNVSRLNCIFQYFQQGITMAKPFEVIFLGGYTINITAYAPARHMPHGQVGKSWPKTQEVLQLGAVGTEAPLSPLY